MSAIGSSAATLMAQSPVQQAPMPPGPPSKHPALPPGPPPFMPPTPQMPPPPPVQGPWPGYPGQGSKPGPKPGPMPGPMPGPKPGPKPTPPPTQQPPTQQPPTQQPPSSGSGPNLKPWLIGAGAVVGAGLAGAAGIAAYRNGAHNIRALRATAAAFESGAMHQGGLQAINDAGLGARFASGIGTPQLLAVALPGVNRVGVGGRLTSVARGHLDHAELLAASTALRRGSGDGVLVHEPMRRHVLSHLEAGEALPTVLDDLDRSAGGARPSFDNEQLGRYWNRTSIVERGRRGSGPDLKSGVSAVRRELRIEDGRIRATNGHVRIDQLVAARGAQLGGRGLASGIGTIQGVNVSTLRPAMQEQAIAMSRVDPSLVETIGLNGAFTQRWTNRLAAGAGPTPS